MYKSINKLYSIHTITYTYLYPIQFIQKYGQMIFREYFTKGKAEKKYD